MYKLANNIELITEQDEAGSDEYLVAVFTNKYKDFVVNKITFDFMQHFNKPISLEDVISHYIEITEAKELEVELVKNQLTNFFNDILNKGWIVKEGEVKVEQSSHEAFFKKGDFIHDYKVLKVLANNELTDVYQVNLHNSRKRLVLKYLNKSKFKNKDRYYRYQDYFFNEFEFLRTFNSMYINKAIDFKKTPEECFMLLQFIDGISISRYVRHKRLSTDDKIKLVTKLLRGFSVIHKHLIYHGDIHLSNILVTRTGQIKIIDFGYSNFADNTEINHRKRRNGGVHAFIPPERALRSINRKFSAVEQFQSEVYQIGLIVYYIFAKELPFQAETWKTMVDEKKQFKLSAYQPFLKRRMPKGVRQVITKALENNPNNRYENATAMLNAWRKYL